MSDKTKVTFTLDTDLVELARIQYPNFSGRVNELITLDLYGTDEEAELIEEIAELSNLLKLKKDKLCKVRKKEAAKNGEKSAIEQVVDWAKTIFSHRGVLGLNVLERECKRKKVSFDHVKGLLDQEGVSFVNFDG